MSWETVLMSVLVSSLAAGVVGFFAGILGMKVKLALVEQKADTSATELLRVRDKVHEHANLLHVLQGRMNGKHK